MIVITRVKGQMTTWYDNDVDHDSAQRRGANDAMQRRTVSINGRTKYYENDEVVNGNDGKARDNEEGNLTCTAQCLPSPFLLGRTALIHIIGVRFTHDAKQPRLALGHGQRRGRSRDSVACARVQLAEMRG